MKSNKTLPDSNDDLREIATRLTREADQLHATYTAEAPGRWKLAFAQATLDSVRTETQNRRRRWVMLGQGLAAAIVLVAVGLIGNQIVKHTSGSNPSGNMAESASSRPAAAPVRGGILPSSGENGSQLLKDNAAPAGKNAVISSRFVELLNDMLIDKQRIEESEHQVRQLQQEVEQLKSQLDQIQDQSP